MGGCVDGLRKGLVPIRCALFVRVNMLLRMGCGVRLVPERCPRVRGVDALGGGGGTGMGFPCVRGVRSL